MLLVNDGTMTKLQNLDAYAKINEDFYRRTLSSGVITIASSIVMLLVFLAELALQHCQQEGKLRLLYQHLHKISHQEAPGKLIQMESFLIRLIWISLKCSLGVARIEQMRLNTLRGLARCVWKLNTLGLLLTQHQIEFHPYLYS
ncbi:uncharacterized protein LOC133834715 [Humulus lupulus]|uniref:uncharacterized protein LOC133834715 n=1 Tax=Humulus lupulus TaxID=3486 RepID=UPI002B4183F9|nr:uncharacterized protein LOC133834715 [Humulus lupulus]